MKEFCKKIAAILMAFVVVTSTMSFSFSEHFCGDHLVDIGIFSKAESCGMELQKPSPNKDCSIEKKNCCNDVLKQFEGQNELKTNTSSLTFKQQVFVATFIISYNNLFDSLEKNKNPFKDYSPPFIVKDIHTLDEVYLI
jgi:hypothetical protein